MTGGLRDCTALMLRACSCFFQAEDGIRDIGVTGVQTCALPIFGSRVLPEAAANPTREPTRVDRQPTFSQGQTSSLTVRLASTASETEGLRAHVSERRGLRHESGGIHLDTLISL